MPVRLLDVNEGYLLIHNGLHLRRTPRLGVPLQDYTLHNHVVPPGLVKT